MAKKDKDVKIEKSANIVSGIVVENENVIKKPPTIKQEEK